MPSFSPCFHRLSVLSKCSSSQCLRHFSIPSSSSFLCRFHTTTACPDHESKNDYEDFYRYTSGRWLWNEASELLGRYKRFNVPALQTLAAQATGAQTCVSISKLAEGGFNKVFRLVMDDGTSVIARLPYPIVKPVGRIMASEVASMEFARTVLEVPVPRVLSWSTSADNPVEAEYMLMEEARGTQLGEVWGAMHISDKLKIMEEIVKLERKFLKVSFTRYGYLYFATDAFPGCEKAEIVGDVPQSVKDYVGEKFVIGPSADREFWHRERAEMDIDRGPWKTPTDYLKAIAHRELAWLHAHAAQHPKPPAPFLPTPEAQRSPAAHIDLYNRFLAVADYILPDSHLTLPTLWHWDLHAPNIFVHENRITSLIDWQDVWTGPLFLQTRLPQLVKYKGEIALELPDNYKDIEDEDEKRHLRMQVEKSIVICAYEMKTKTTNPILHEFTNVPLGQYRRDTFDLMGNTWDGEILSFRQTLIRVARHWDEIRPDIPCPISFSDEEFSAHLRDADGWNEHADMWDSLAGFVSRDGWTANENYEDARQMFAEAREHMLQDLEGDERKEWEERTRWVVRKEE